MTNLDENQKQEAQELYSKLIQLHTQKANLEAIKKDREETLKNDIASVCNIRNKAGEPVASKVKMPIVLAILNELYKQKPNKKNEEADMLEIFRKAIKKEEVSKEIVNDYLSVENALEENKQDIKEAFKETTLLSKEMLNAISLIVKEEYKIMKEDNLAQAGFESKPPKDNSEILEIKAELENVLKADKE